MNSGSVRFNVEVVKTPSFMGKALSKIDDFISVMNAACLLVENDAKKKCPVDTGELRQSIRHEITREGQELIGIVETDKKYAPYVEFGTGLFAANGDGRKDVPWSYQTEDGKWHSTSGQKPQPFMKPALDDNRTEIIRLFKEALK